MKLHIPVHKNEEYPAKVVDLTYEGNGVVKIDDFPVFVPNALPGEKITVRITKVASHFAWGRVMEWQSKSPDRVNVKDKKYIQTGIAPLGHLKYAAQLKFKQHQIKELLEKAHLADIEVAPTMGMDKPYHYRNKAQVPVKLIHGQLQTGFYKRGSHTLVPIEDFYIQDPKIDEAVVVVRDLLRKYHIQPYDERTGKGVIRTVMVRRGYYSHEVMVVLVTNTKRLPMADQIVDGIVAGVPEVKSIVQNLNDKKTNRLLGDKNKTLWGAPEIHDQLLGIDFAISPLSFYQVNPQQTERLYQTAIDNAGLDGSQTVIDAYCGIGTISLAVAKNAKQVYGVEIVPAAIDDAKHNAKRNGIKNAKFVVGKAEEQFAKWQEAGLKPDVVIVDPPRKGLAESLIEATGKMAPKKVIYVSCNPATLVRDIQRFADHGYHVTKPIQPVDQFPQTTHVESVTVLERTEK
ncbi:TrmA family tRNA (uracil-5-)-methyltransferase [Limosilactobacillus frumenti DSM 13145]|uniref:TrmA family tRNA (Uracil-5-)-methyltransferase n=1 Tax=Limosilactobacillus frumenti DSM 13145 TaxID=1423746 RepID=A0A0R1PDC0_9LACO|nr:23S rRNA (uracil(1939)-C(5))-methyltransferase RlmD [Limosilactobacillus frumenti]KRL28130.1 TrmA family tRNA (uracil-5-)-methyltransferase [Limosilactobacillus frumenti DSM 13145]QFG73045.1 23S rRNA (uracil(1939)-C(5))-methyltransferase RlmD [Limosilactobacillus frumenti]